jgi:hypothetical protein
LSTGLIIIVTLIYAAVCISSAAEGNIGMSIMFGAYALANVGLLIATS